MFCDIFSLYYAPLLKKFLNGQVDGLMVTEEFLLAFSIIMEIPMVMILLSAILQTRINKLLNIVFPSLLILLQIWSLSTGKNTLHYWFFSSIEIATCITIILLASKLKNDILTPYKLIYDDNRTL